MRPTLLILAAGMGSRYGGLKQIDPVGPSGEAIIDYSVYDALRAGFGKLVFVIRRDIEAAFHASIGSRFEGKAPVAYAFQELDALPPGCSPPRGRTKPWGTGHAVLTAGDLIHEPCAAINADDFYGAESYRLLSEHLHTTADDDVAQYAMVGFGLANTLSDSGAVSRGVCECDADGCLRGIREIPKIEKHGDGGRYTDGDGGEHVLPGDTTVSMNFWGFTPSVFPCLRRDFASFIRANAGSETAEFHIPVAVGQLVAAGEARVRVLSTPERWCGVTYQEDKPSVIARIRRLVDRGVYPARLWG
jgi:hypothetical protein